jgi:hypothetical protein
MPDIPVADGALTLDPIGTVFDGIIFDANDWAAGEYPLIFMLDIV